MADNQDQEKTEEPTSKKREDARKKGQVAQSREIPAVLILSGSLAVMFFGGSWMLTRLATIMRVVHMKAGHMELVPETVTMLLWELFQKTVIILIPLMLVAMICGIVGNISQFGFLLTGEKLTPKFSKLNPISGIKKLFSIQSLFELFKSVLKLVIVAGISYLVVKKHLFLIPGLMQLSVGEILSFIGLVSFKMFLYTILVLIILAAIDYIFVRWRHEKDLKMTKQEVKDEYKQREGDPAVKARIKTMQREMARRRMMEAIPEATVVITNPTHLAIAIQYEDGMHAPTVVAKGAGFVAQRIKEIAKENNIPIVEQKPLARAMFKNVEIGDFVPADLYRAVAEILAYVYRLKSMV